MPGQHKSSALCPVPGLSPATPALECLLFAWSPWLASSLLAFVFNDSPLGRLGAVAPGASLAGRSESRFPQPPCTLPTNCAVPQAQWGCAMGRAIYPLMKEFLLGIQT